MACAPIHTGEGFLQGVLSHIDCQAQSIGSLGWGGLADPGSPVSLALSSLLTIFVAIFGIRVMLGYTIGIRDGVTGLLKVGIVLTLAASWPAWRVLGYDLFINGPEQLSNAIGAASGLPGNSGDLVSRLQAVDDGIAALNLVGTGRLGATQGDAFQLGFSRIAYLVGTLGPMALMRIAAGFLVAIAPLMGGLLLFSGTVGLFEGWLRALAATFLGAISTTLMLGIELSLLEPWLQEVLDKRAAQQLTLEAPVEALVISAAFTIITIGGLLLVTRLSFHQTVATALVNRDKAPSGASHPASSTLPHLVARSSQVQIGTPSVAQSLTKSIEREARLGKVLHRDDGARPVAGSAGALGYEAARRGAKNLALGTSWRRPAARMSRSAQHRDTNL